MTVQDDFNEARIFLPNYGIQHLSLIEAAELIVIDMWVCQDIEGPPELRDDLSIETYDPRLKVALAEPIKSFVGRLTKAVDSGTLKPAVLRRDFDENLIPESTFIDKTEFIDWLDERGHSTDAAFEEWSDLQDEIDLVLSAEADALRALGRGGHRVVRWYRLEKFGRTEEKSPEDGGRSEVLTLLQHSLAENAKLKDRVAELEGPAADRAVRPLLTRERDTLLALVAILCGEAEIDYSRPAKAAGVLVDAAARLGVSIGETTIENHLKRIPDALSGRLR